MAAAPERPAPGKESIKQVQRKLILIPPDTMFVSFALDEVDPQKTFVILSTAVEANGIGNSKAPNGACVHELTRNKLTIRVEKEESKNRYVSAEVVEFP